MRKNLAKMLWLSAISVVLVGCGLSDKTSPESCKFEVSQSLDKGDYDAVIQKLSSDPTCGDAYTQEEGKIQLAAAYIGKAGFSIPDVISDIIDSASKNTDTYQAFVQSVAKKVNSQSVNALTKAKDLYKQLIQGYNCSSTDLPDIIKDACFYKNITYSAIATSSLALVIGGGSTEDIVQKIESWTNPSTCADLNQNNVGDNAESTACAIEWALNGNCNNTGLTSNTTSSSVTFTDQDNNPYTYTLLEIIIPNNANLTDDSGNTCNDFKDYKLIYNNTVVVTNGYCDTNFNQCNTPNPNNNCYPCPVIINNNPLDLTETVVDTLNNIDEITNIVGDTEVSQDLLNLKQNICGTNGCSLDDIQIYLQ